MIPSAVAGIVGDTIGIECHRRILLEPEEAPLEREIGYRKTAENIYPREREREATKNPSHDRPMFALRSAEYATVASIAADSVTTSRLSFLLFLRAQLAHARDRAPFLRRHLAFFSTNLVTMSGENAR